MHNAKPLVSSEVDRDFQLVITVNYRVYATNSNGYQVNGTNSSQKITITRKNGKNTISPTNFNGPTGGDSSTSGVYRVNVTSMAISSFTYL